MKMGSAYKPINWNICPICGYNIYNGKEWTHQKEGDFHIDCLVKYYIENKKKLGTILKNKDKI